MNEKSKNQITTLTKISIVANILLFGTTGIIYLARLSYTIGFILIIAGLTNIISILFTFNKKNMIFMAINFLFAVVSLVVFLDYQVRGSKYISLLWLAITCYYTITAIILLIRINKEKKAGQASA